MSLTLQCRMQTVEARVGRGEQELLLPVPQATAIAFVLTSRETWKALVKESGLPQLAALDLVATTLDTVLFAHMPA